MNFYEALEALRRYEACEGHRWQKPRRSTHTYGYGRHCTVTEVYETKCRKCGMRASRPTLEQVNTEVISRLKHGVF